MTCLLVFRYMGFWVGQQEYVLYKRSGVADNAFKIDPCQLWRYSWLFHSLSCRKKNNSIIPTSYVGYMPSAFRICFHRVNRRNNFKIFTTKGIMLETIDSIGFITPSDSRSPRFYVMYHYRSSSRGLLDAKMIDQ